jgi:hypothetical protein
VQSGPYKPGDPTKRLRDYFKSNKKNQPPNYTRIPHTQRTPRVRQVSHRRTGRDGKYATLVFVPEDYLDSRIVTPPIPDIAIFRGWLYVNGNSPCVGTTAVVAQAEGCKLLLYYYTQSGHKYSRTCYLEGSPESLVWVYPDPEDRGKVGWLTPGTYTDADVDLSSTNNGKFLRWKDSLDGLPVVHDLATLNEGTNPPTPTYATVMAAVAQGVYTEPID